MTSLLMRRPHLKDLPPLPELAAGYTLRVAHDADMDGIATVLQGAFPNEGWTGEKARQALSKADGVETVFLVEQDGKAVATASSRLIPTEFPGSGYVHWVAADAAHKGQRLGWVVSLATLHDFVRLGCTDAVLETQDFRLPAIKTYLRLGFVPEYRDAEHIARWSQIFIQLLAT